MTLLELLPWAQIAVSVILTTLILLQSGNEGGLGGAFGGGDGGGTYHTRRGLEKILFTATIITGITFGALAVLSLFLTS